MSSYQCARPEDTDAFYTLEGLAADFHISPHTVRKYIENGHVPPSLGKHPNGLNYDHTHYQALSRIYADLAPLRNRPTLRQRTRRSRAAHVVIVHPRHAEVA